MASCEPPPGREHIMPEDSAGPASAQDRECFSAILSICAAKLHPSGSERRVHRGAEANNQKVPRQARHGLTGFRNQRDKPWRCVRAD